MNMITYFNDLVTKNFNNYLKKYFMLIFFESAQLMCTKI